MFDRETLRRYIVTNEGWETRVYRDSLGIPTIGVGFNLNRADARERITELGLSYEAVLNNEVELNETQINILLNRDIDTAISIARQLFSNFEQISSTRQIVLIDLAFNLGPNRLAGFTRMINAVNTNDWAQAATELQNSRWYTQVRRRGVWNVGAIRNNNLPNFQTQKPKESKEGSEGSEGSENKEQKEGSEGSERKEGSEGSERKEGSEGSENKEQKEGKEHKEGSEGSENKEQKEGSEGSENKEQKEGSEGSENKEGSEGSERSEWKESHDITTANKLISSLEFQQNEVAEPNPKLIYWYNISI